MSVSQPLASSAIRKDLAELTGMIRDRFAYADANNYDYEGALSALASSADGNLTPAQLGYKVHQILANFIDGHAWAAPYQLNAGHLPLILEPLGERIVTVKADRSALLAEDHPYLASIDGLPISEWLAAARKIVPIGTPQYTHFRSVRHLYDVQHWRSVLNLPLSSTCVLGLTDEASTAVVEREVSLVDEPLEMSRWPSGGSRILDGNIGYLRLRRMNAEAVEEIRTWMPRLRHTDALIVDVRDNTGGLRTPLLELFAWLADPAAEPLVGSVGAYRRWSGFDADHLSARYMIASGDPRLTDAQQAAITRFQASFQPEADLHDERFSAWHYLVLPQTATLANPADISHYDRPVTVLQNEKCFSAVDIFLGALRQLPNVRLFGVPSSGGSAYGVRHQLTESGVTLRLGSMISFQPDGSLYDTRGINPDVCHQPRPEDFTADGGADSTLEAALLSI